MELKTLKRMKPSEIITEKLWDITRNNEKREKLRPGELCFSYEFGICKVLELSGSESYFFVLPLSQPTLRTFIYPLRIKREVVGVWEVEFLPESIRLGMTSSELALFKMLYPEASVDLLQDVEKYLVKTTAKEKIQNIFKKVLTRLISLVR